MGEDPHAHIVPRRPPGRPCSSRARAALYGVSMSTLSSSSVAIHSERRGFLHELRLYVGAALAGSVQPPSAPTGIALS